MVKHWHPQEQRKLSIDYELNKFVFLRMRRRQERSERFSSAILLFKIRYFIKQVQDWYDASKSCKKKTTKLFALVSLHASLCTWLIAFHAGCNITTIWRLQRQVYLRYSWRHRLEYSCTSIHRKLTSLFCLKQHLPSYYLPLSFPFFLQRI